MEERERDWKARSKRGTGKHGATNGDHELTELLFGEIELVQEKSWKKMTMNGCKKISR